MSQVGNDNGMIMYSQGCVEWFMGKFLLLVVSDLNGQIRTGFSFREVERFSIDVKSENSDFDHVKALFLRFAVAFIFLLSKSWRSTL